TAVVLLAALQPARRLTQLVDRGAKVVLDLGVPGDARGDAGHAAGADQLVIDLACRRVRLLHVVTKLLVVQRAVDVRLRAAGDSCDSVLGLGHAPLVLSLRNGIGDGMNPAPDPTFSRVYPRHARRKRPAFAVLALVVVLAGCGGGSGGGGGTTTTVEGTRVAGNGFTFAAPGSWQVTRTASTVTVRPGTEGPTLASVTRLNGKVIARRSVLVRGMRSRQYDVAYEKDGTGVIDRITFVLRGKREYYVVCRWPADEGEPAACGLLQSSFSLR